MTNLQWLFHYYEVLQEEARTKQYIDERVKILIDYLELVGTLANPEAGAKFQEFKKLWKAQEEISAEEFEETWDQLKKKIPNKLIVTSDKLNKKYFLPKYERKTQNNNKNNKTYGIKVNK